LNVYELISYSLAETKRLGARLGQLLHGGEVICLEGELGTGKTTFTQGIGRGLGVTEPVISPSFVLVREHPAPAGRPTLYHIDCYRLEKLDEALALGLEDYLYGDGVCVIEWAEKVKPVLPQERLWITLAHLGGNKRSLRLEARGQRHERLLEELRDFGH